MGDERRNDLFSKFIKKQFPKAKSIFVIADGRGIFSRKLANKGFRVTSVENSPRFIGPGHKLIRYWKLMFDGDDSSIDERYGPFDLIVGMHPDEATGEILRYAVRCNIPFAVVPCCIKGRDAKGIGDFSGWVKKLKSMVAPSHNIFEYYLKMNGKNLCLYGKPKIKK